MKHLSPNPKNKYFPFDGSRRTNLYSLGAITAAGLLSFANTSALASTGAISRVSGLPTELDEFSTQGAWRKRGTATLRVMLFKVYDATLWANLEKVNPLAEGAPFALDITYALAVKREDLVKTSIEEMTRLRSPNAATLGRWNLALNSVFPSVVSGDRLLGVSLPNKRGARFFHNGKLTGEIADSAFSEAFFAIWLDDNTKKPDVRRALLGA